MAGQSTTTLPLAATVDQILGLSDSSTVRQEVSNLALQILTSPELAALIANSALFQGEWIASGGSFPSADQKGQFWRVSQGGAGTVDGVPFVASDMLIALTDDASTSVYAGNWHKAAFSSFQHTHGIAEITDAADVAASGDYNDLNNTPTLGTAAAAATGDFATAAQGGKADSALQAGDVAPAARSTAQPAVSYGSLGLFETAVAAGFTAPDGTMAFVQRSGTTIAILKAASGAPAVVDEAPAGWVQFLLLGA